MNAIEVIGLPRRTPAQDAAFVGCALIWLICFGLSLDTAGRQIAYPPVLVERAADASTYPSVVSPVRGLGGTAFGLRSADRVLSAAGVDLKGAGPVTWSSAFASSPGRHTPVPVEVERGGERLRLEVVPGSYRAYWPRLVASLAFALAAAVLYLRARPSSMIHAFVWANWAAAFFFACTFAGSVTLTAASAVVHGVSLAFAAPLGMRAVMLFPMGSPPRSGWLAALPWLFVSVGIFDASRFYEIPFSRPIGATGSAVAGALYTFAVLVLVTRTYRSADPIGRRQLRWLLLGFYIAMIPAFAAIVLAAVAPRFAPTLAVTASSLAAIPAFLLISIFRYNWFDIDRLVSSAASYSILITVLLAALLAVVPPVAEELATRLEMSATAAQILGAVVLAAVLVPAHRALRPQIERVFFFERHALELGIGQLLSDLSGCEKLEDLLRIAGERLDRLIRPEAWAVYTRAGDSFAPAFVRGRAIPPAFDSHGALATALSARDRPLASDEVVQGPDSAAMDPFDRAALETLGVPVVIPVRRGGELVSFACLGPKVSGDVYTATDLSLLGAVADKISSELHRFDQEEVLRASRAMQASLRRYVPDVLAERLVRGEELDLGEREVSVLFVDIRGYSGYAEPLSDDEIFSTVNHYTETVSAIVKGHGGTVVEFNGDGMMAVFGAPQPHPNKEQSAADAGEEIVDAVAALEVSTGAGRRLSVGVGIATGWAFVGNIRAVDRLIWTAIGNTTNLAARLQGLTRELDAAMVIDEHTWKLAGDRARRFQKHEDAIVRGRERRENLYSLPLAAPA